METSKKKERMIQGFILAGGLVTATIFFFAIKLIGHDVNMGGRDQGLKVGTVLPEFSLPDLSGRIVSSREYKGKNMLVMFADPNCGFCKKLLPIVRDFSSKKVGRINLVIVSSGTDSSNKVLAETYKISCPVLRGDRKLYDQRYKVSGVPFLYMVDREGVIRGKQGGWSSDAENVLKKMVKKAS